MGLAYNSLLLEQIFFPWLNFSLSFFYFPSPSFVPTFFLFFMCSLFFLFLSFIFEKVFSFSHFVLKNQGALVKIYLEDVYNIFYYQWFVYISIAHTIHIFLYFFITLFKFYKNVCKEMCTNHDLFFFLLVDINLIHNVILYFFITLLILYW